jgi:hypothetical protein
MIARVILSIVGLCMMLACSPVEPPSTPPGHPASPDAQVAPAYDVATDLHIGEADRPTPPPEMQGKMKHDMEGSHE